MAKNSSIPVNPNREGIDLDGEGSFKDIGLDSRLIRALAEKGIRNPTPIQRVAIPSILEGKDVVAIAKTGTGKTYAYLLPLLHKLFSGFDSGSGSKSCTVSGQTAFVLGLTRTSSQQVYSEIISLIDLCGVPLKVVHITSSLSHTELEQAFSPLPDILVSTPAWVHKCLSAGVLQPKAIQESLSMLILDEADFLLQFGYEDDLSAFMSHVPRSCHCHLMTATSCDDVEKLKKLILRNPYLLTVPDNDEILSNSVDQLWVSSDEMEAFEELISELAEHRSRGGDFIADIKQRIRKERSVTGDDVCNARRGEDILIAKLSNLKKKSKV